MKPTSHRDVLQQAVSVLKDRGATYGGVEESFTRAAALASLKLNRTVTPYDVAIILESVKDARRAANPEHYDSHLDGINYRAFAAEFSGALPGVTTTREMAQMLAAEKTEADNAHS